MIFDRLMTENGAAVAGALVVAHPDDEALWFGGLLTQVPFEWTVICCSIPEADPLRAWKFFEACDRLEVKGKLIPLQEGRGGIRPAVPGLLMDALGGFDVIVTHSYAGEYGHVDHQVLHRTIKGFFPNKTAWGCYGDAPGPFRIPLTEDQMRRKLRALEAYDHVAPADRGLLKWEALLARYSGEFDLGCETYDGPP